MNPRDGQDAPEGASADHLVNLLHNELRTARGAILDDGIDPDEVIADITERVRRLRNLSADGWHGPPPTAAANGQ